jgi:putative hemolysin
VGTCRLLAEPPFASEAEFDLAPLLGSGLALLEVGRTCLDPAYRGGAALHRLWQGIAAVVEAEGVSLLFGLASFPGTDPAAHTQALGGLMADHLAPARLRPRSRVPAALPDVALDRRAAHHGTPALIRAYLRMGGRVGEGAFVDHAFNCTDVCLVLETAALPPLRRALRAAL